MSLEHSPARAAPGNSTSSEPATPNPPDDPDYWYGLIDEKAAADFLDVTVRFLQGRRQRGGGPQFIRISSRCIRYTRALLKSYTDARMRKSTSDPGQEAA